MLNKLSVIAAGGSRKHHRPSKTKSKGTKRTQAAKIVKPALSSLSEYLGSCQEAHAEFKPAKKDNRYIQRFATELKPALKRQIDSAFDTVLFSLAMREINSFRQAGHLLNSLIKSSASLTEKYRERIDNIFKEQCALIDIYWPSGLQRAIKQNLRISPLTSPMLRSEDLEAAIRNDLLQRCIPTEATRELDPLDKKFYDQAIDLLVNNESSQIPVILLFLRFLKGHGEKAFRQAAYSLDQTFAKLTNSRLVDLLKKQVQEVFQTQGEKIAKYLPQELQESLKSRFGIK